MNNILLESLGWAGSLLLIVSILQSRMARLRWMNLIASTALILYNAVIMSWPMVAMNLAVAGINVFYLVRMRRDRRAEPASEPSLE